MRYLTGRGNVHCGMYLLRQISVGHLSGRGNVRRGCVWSGKCPSGMCLVGEVSVGDVSGNPGGCFCRDIQSFFAEKNENDENYMVKWLNVVWGREFAFISVKVIASINFKVFRNQLTQSANCHKKWSSELFCMHVLTKYNFKERSLNTSTSTEKSNDEFFFKTIWIWYKVLKNWLSKNCGKQPLVKR